MDMTGFVALADCDKTPPGMMMAMARLNIPSIILYGGSTLPGNFNRKTNNYTRRL
jgi:dihydroxyacid dehydratase (EC 4.2.1.9)